MSRKVVLAGACRTAIGVMGGALSTVPAEQLGARMAALSKAEHNLVTRAIPLVLKDPILRIANAFNESCMAGSISNIGKVTLPEQER